MAIWSVGSIQDHIGNLIGWTNVPTSISGTTFDNLIEQAINHANNFTNDGIGIIDIAAKYQPALIDLSYSQLLKAIETQEGGVDNVSLGPLRVGQGRGGNAQLAVDLEKQGEKKLKELGRHIRFARVIGGA